MRVHDCLHELLLQGTDTGTGIVHFTVFCVEQSGFPALYIPQVYNLVYTLWQKSANFYVIDLTV